MLVTGEFISADEAKARGLVNRVAEPKQLDTELEKLVSTILTKPRSAVAIGKKFFIAKPNVGIAAAYEAASQTMACNMMDNAALRRRAGVHRKTPATLEQRMSRGLGGTAIRRSELFRTQRVWTAAVRQRTDSPWRTRRRFLSPAGNTWKVRDREDALAPAGAGRDVCAPPEPADLTTCDSYSSRHSDNVRRRTGRRSVAANHRRSATGGGRAWRNQLLRQSKVSWSAAQNVCVGSIHFAGFR